MEQFTREHQMKMEASIVKTIDRLTGVNALIASWEQTLEPDDEYLRSLKAKATKLRAQLRVKGVLS
jgi:hypothetical protein